MESKQASQGGEKNKQETQNKQDTQIEQETLTKTQISETTIESPEFGRFVSRLNTSAKYFPSPSPHISFSVVSFPSPAPKKPPAKLIPYICSTPLPYSPLSKTNTAAQAPKLKKNFEKSKDDVVQSAQAPEVPKPKKKPTQKNLPPISSLSISAKPTLSFAVIGHVDAGKLTLMGLFLKSLGKVNKAFLKRLETESAKAGKKSFALAWIMDQTEDERSRGVTIDICTTSVSTSKADFVVIDAPGHRDFVPQMVSGVSQADIGLLIVDAAPDAFEAGFSYDGQTKEHALISHALGLQALVIVLNKMDIVDYSNERYEDIKGRLLDYLKEVGYSEGQLSFVPVLAISGVNLILKPLEPQLSWYSGPTLLEALQQRAVTVQPEDLASERLVFQAADIITSYHLALEFLVVGRVNLGVVRPGESVVVCPGGAQLEVAAVRSSESVSGKEIEALNDSPAAKKFDNNVYLFFKDKAAKEEAKTNPGFLRSGDILTKPGEEVPSTVKFVCEVNAFELRGAPLLPGTKLLVHTGGQMRPVEILKLIAIVGPDGKRRRKKMMHVGSHKTAIIEFEVIEAVGAPRPLPLMTFEEDSRMGRVVFRRGGFTVAEGKVLACEREKKE